MILFNRPNTHYVWPQRHVWKSGLIDVYKPYTGLYQLPASCKFLSEHQPHVFPPPLLSEFSAQQYLRSDHPEKAKHGINLVFCFF